MFVFLKMYHLLNKTGDGYIYHKYVSLSLCDLLFNPKRVRECNTVLNGWHAYLLNRKGNGFCCGESPQVSDQLHLPLTSFHLQRHKRSIGVPPTTTNRGHTDIILKDTKYISFIPAMFQGQRWRQGWAAETIWGKSLLLSLRWLLLSSAVARIE